MKSKFCINQLFSVGMIIFLMLFISACSSSSTEPPPASNHYLTYVADPVMGTSELVRGDTTWTDMVITGRVMFTPEVSYVSFGRVSDGGYFYQLVVSRAGMYIYKVASGGTDTHGVVTITPALVDNQWYTVRFVISGTQFTGYVDGVKYTDYTDSSGTGETQGNIFLQSDDDGITAGRHACFDDIVVTNGDGSVTYISEDFESYPLTTNWTPTGGWTPNNIGRGTFAIVSE
jgi:hypothetical protein